MNAKNKIIALVMSFVICFCTFSNSFANDKEQLNYNIEPLVVDGGVISVPMLATVSALAVGTGIVLKNSDDIYDIGRLFYDYIKSHNEMTWEFVQSAFLAGHTVIDNYVHVDSNFLDIVKGFFDSTFSSDYVGDNNVIPIGGLPIYPNYTILNSGSTIIVSDLKLTLYKRENADNYEFVYENLSGNYKKTWSSDFPRVSLYLEPFNSGYSLKMGLGVGTQYSYSMDYFKSDIYLPSHSLPYSGGYDWGKAEDKKENDSIALPIPGNLGNLVGQTSDDFWSNNKDLAGSNPITKPNVESPSIDSTDGVFVGGSTINPPVDVPGEGLFASIKDFIISLVVPSDTFWTDLFTGFRDNLQINFPMLDMSAFDSLLVNGKPFPNMFAFGGKIVDGDTINSIVNWLRPIVAGFVMLLLLFFNYRKLHKIIRNSDPYGSVAEKGCTSNVN